VSLDEDKIRSHPELWRETVLLYQWGFGLRLTDEAIDALSAPAPLTRLELDLFGSHFGQVPDELDDPVNRIAVRLFALSETGPKEWLCPDFIEPAVFAGRKEQR
jgi:hypothetical protein